MRIVAGRFRGRPLATLGKGDPGAHLRPTPDRVRESLFSMLTHLGVIEGAHVLDLFAGTGALGLEALSRGAARVTFVDDGRVAQGLIRRNIAALGVGSQTRLITASATRLPDCDDTPADLVFLDPPYGQGLAALALGAASSGGWLADDALILCEESAPMPPPDGFELHDQRKYGATHVTLLRVAQ